MWDAENRLVEVRPTTPVPLHQSYEFDADGNLAQTWAAGDMNCDGLVEVGDVNAFQAALLGRAYYESQYPNCNWLNADINGDGNVDLGDVNPFVALVAGGGNAALAQTLTWDAENRLVRVEPTAGQYSPQPVVVLLGHDVRTRGGCAWSYPRRDSR